MAVNRYFAPTVFSAELYVPPVDYIEKALEKAQKEYDTNFMVAQAMKNKYVDSLRQDRAKADEIQMGIEKKIDNIVSSYSGDYSRATKDLYLLQSEIEKMYNPGGQAHAIATNKAAVDDAKKRELERLAKGEITQQQYAALMHWVDNSYTGIGEKDPITGSYNMLNVPALAKYVDEDSIFKEVEKTVPWRKSKVVKDVVGNDGRIHKITEEVEVRDPQELSNAFQSALMNNDQYMEYMMQRADLVGEDLLSAIDGQVFNYQKNIIPAYSGYKNRSQGHELEEDPIATDYRRHRLALDLEREKQKNRKELKGMDLAAQNQMPELAVLNTVNTGYSKYKEIPTEIDVPVPGGPMGSPLYMTKAPRSVDKMLASRKETNVNYKLLEALRKAMPNAPDKDVLNAYNLTIKRGDTYGTETYYYPFTTTDSQKEEADRLLPRLQTGQATVYKLNADTGEVEELKGNKITEKLGEWYDGKNRKAKIKAIGKSSPITGNLPYGTVLQGEDNAYYIVGDNSLRLSRFNESDATGKSMRERAFGFIQNPTSEVGDAFQIFYDNKPMTIIGKKEYGFDPVGRVGVPTVNYYQAVQGQNGLWTPTGTPLATNGENWTPFDIGNMLITPDILMSSMPRNKISASSEGNTPYEIND
jgi:hypothetical protein